MAKISLRGLTKAAVLAALYNGSHPQGMGFMQYSPVPMTVEQAQALLDGGQTYFDYLKGRVMKIHLDCDELDPWGYDRDNGPEAAKKIIDSLRLGNKPDNSEILAHHAVHTIQAANQAEERSV